MRSRFLRPLLITLAIVGFAFIGLIVLSEDAAKDETEDRPPSSVGKPAVTEASPEAPAAGPAEAGQLSPDDEALVVAATNAYIGALNAHDAFGVCALFEPGALPLTELPRGGGGGDGGGCEAALGASIGVPPKGGGPAWKRTTIQELNEVSVGPDRARVTATVNHQFSDRKYVSVEEDVIYLDRNDDRWLLAKPSGTLYRAVGYPEPPLRALTPP